VLIVQVDDFNRSRISTVIVAVLASNLAFPHAPGKILVRTRRAGPPKDSIETLNFQEFHLLPYLTEEENVRSAAIALKVDDDKTRSRIASTDLH
jgi:mRNA interferase MazF